MAKNPTAEKTPAESRFPIFHDKCPHCKSKETSVQLAYDEVVVAKGKGEAQLASSEKKMVPLLQPTLAGVAVPCLVDHSATCAGCGLSYCVKSEIVMAPVTMQPPPGQGQRKP